MVKLGINIDHVATLREARKGCVPSPVEAAKECIKAGCDSIVCHLREDRRHINDKDVMLLRRLPDTRLNLEMSIAEEIVRIACKVRPDQATLVPERRREITTEGGLDVIKYRKRIRSIVSRLNLKGISVSLFINPVKSQIKAALGVGAGIIELHTGEYANAKSNRAAHLQFLRLKGAARYAASLGLEVNAGHGLDYDNVEPVAAIGGMNELNIGHSIISRAVFVGIGEAARQMLELVK